MRLSYVVETLMKDVKDVENKKHLKCLSMAKVSDFNPA